MKTDSKAEYENSINDIPVPHEETQSAGGRIPDHTTRYGSWLRRNDPIAFEVGYQEWARENRFLHQREQGATLAQEHGV